MPDTGGGWTTIKPGVVPFAIAGIVDVPWGMTNQQHPFTLNCLDLDGEPLMVNDEQPLFGEGAFGAGRPMGVRPGAAIPVPFALSFMVPLPPGGHYEWRLSIRGETQDDWRLPFSTAGQALAEAA